MEIGAKVIVYTLIVRGNTQTSYVGTIIAISEQGITIESTSGKTFFPFTAIERMTF